ncbi:MULTISPECIES: Rid family detoxifying hydrolase [Acidithiobacillus]|jgi:reactive intermediate/imine deaminase|uniref:Endoribonuclease L-PSP, putative n=2 Tax=Acidithiobacillus ferrooxidans TaxID=920 RepID=B7J585_ACIF2|nr:MULTISPECIES: Rid family detoxifying hydrolase [Acidithiobacillus]EGQ61300.1 endoribonuclease L-PSP, putative [Acidithiobacillus sp. GGI-221]MCL5957115.1 Rid family detoxifying hydrolase [Gammaproteobacteria bacterium]ACH82971.1 endoribonuclease L-PSP [Acidithiobacillus ferrooxidans ATCC 53993]ACK79174.1 endoribonuclease L-PSP, putative [Acidithiobacillus ferrooxidans ATCC 23270]MBN6744874.1 RidA family protein [Acidithiobacillus sp. MC2.2]
MPVSVESSSAPQAIGAYSQGMVHGGLLYLSGQIPLDPRTGQMVEGDIALQIRRVLDNLQAVCNAAGGRLQDAIKLQVYLTDLGHFAQVNQAMEAEFSIPYPARAVVQVAALPRGAQVEIDGIVALGKAG